MQQTQMNFNHCIFDHFEIPASNGWAYKLRAEKEQQIKEDVMWISRLLDKYLTTK